MPVKKGKKGPALITADEDIAAFGFKLHDIVRTPLGITAVVIGVKYESADDKQTGRIWVKYENGHEAPLEPKLNAGFMSSLGYRKCSEADHIRRDVGSHMTEAKKQDEERKVVEEVLRCKEQGLPIPEHLLPKPKKEKKPKEAKKK
ncbi:hypothetical protein CHLRE_12g513650v5 [Chlamydomonas reinhardtii]|uniref:Uncharacterized protein n=1 Tax=Chlamydomonas reinhardtii TaxID=3055 RepID=A8JHA7_CHLRE|nr:uncharacterized protein CHLRE_12g513650v5 [Chlamydomonas reinhardtii]PNW75125.1 hypothetical protein CHLRE_12g513650v5 [Chlamydomonas reinhardtii]|eukprot:XP_001702997.1 predicted protein [Chlamydomonas reinhardtii]